MFSKQRVLTLPFGNLLNLIFLLVFFLAFIAFCPFLLLMVTMETSKWNLVPCGFYCFEDSWGYLWDIRASVYDLISHLGASQVALSFRPLLFPNIPGWLVFQRSSGGQTNVSYHNLLLMEVVIVNRKEFASVNVLFLLACIRQRQWNCHFLSKGLGFIVITKCNI